MGYNTLKQLLNVRPVGNAIFGPDSAGGLTWQDYQSVVRCIRPIDDLVGRCDRVFPLICQEIPPPITFLAGHPNQGVERCEGRKVDARVPWRANNQNFPGNVTLQLRQPGDDFLTWDDTAPRESHHQRYPEFNRLGRRHPLGLQCMPGRGIHPVCFRCYHRHRADISANARANYPHNSMTPNPRRWARLCKRHTLLIRSRPRPDPLPLRQGRYFDTLPENQARLPYYQSTCDCFDKVFGPPGNSARMCLGCVDESTRALQDRADHWMRLLRHTHRRQRRGTRPYVEFDEVKKPARLEPGCPYRNCGRNPWTGTRDSEIMGLSVCLACSTVVAS